MRVFPRKIRFSLGMLFVVMTAFCVWIGIESIVVNHRANLRREAESQGVFHFTTASSVSAPGRPISSYKSRNLTLMRYCLGDRAVNTIHVDRLRTKEDQDLLNRLREAFPEADIGGP